jgi:hypothetical protein
MGLGAEVGVSSSILRSNWQGIDGRMVSYLSAYMRMGKGEILIHNPELDMIQGFGGGTRDCLAFATS